MDLWTFHKTHDGGILGRVHKIKLQKLMKTQYILDVLSILESIELYCCQRHTYEYNLYFREWTSHKLVLFNLWNIPSVLLSSGFVYIFNHWLIKLFDQYKLLSFILGQWLNARVKSVDCALVQMLFVKDFRTEWIYRGSTRLHPIFENSKKALGSLSHRGNQRVRNNIYRNWHVYNYIFKLINLFIFRQIQYISILALLLVVMVQTRVNCIPTF